MYKERKIRSIVKTFSWRFVATATTFSLVFIFTRKWDLAVTVGGREVVLKMLFYFLHERGWDKIRWGRQEIHPIVVWITGLSGSGKTTLARKVTERLLERGLKTDHLDGETIRGLFPETGFSKTEVDAHVKRVGLLASRLENRGVFVIASFVSPYKESREFVRRLCRRFVEVYLSTPIEVCEKWDGKNLYRSAREGKIRNIPGVDVTYEAPENPEVNLDMSRVTIDDAAERVLKYLKKNR